MGVLRPRIKKFKEVCEFLSWEANFHSKGVELQAKIVELRSRPENFERLEAEPKLFPESKGPIQGTLDDIERDVGAEDFEKIIEVVTNMGR
jgi:hypothetical protein